MTALTRDDLSVIEGDARISDARLMEVLGHKHRKDVHELIRRNMSELGSRGGSVDLNRFQAFSKWFSAFVTPPPLRGAPC